MNKKDILILATQPGFNPDQTWITWIPCNYATVYSKTDKYNGLRLFTLNKNRIRVDCRLYEKLEKEDFLAPAVLEYNLVDTGSLNPIIQATKLTIGNKSFDLIQNIQKGANK